MSFVKCCFDSELPDFVESVIQKCTDPGCCCGCCSALRPRYKRLVDNIFPVTPQDGLVKNNMEKLTFYSLSSPEKLDRIGEYLFQKASRDIYRRRNGFVIIAMEAMDQLLVACHAQTLNLFVESFLKMVQKLLESTDPQLQILATQSFVRFANIEEDTPSYHRRYDFFVSKFSSMCHSNHPEKETRDQIRLAGIKGLQGVVRKTICDDLVENIWEANHMDKIVPSLLFNMQNSSYEAKEETTPARVAQEERCDPPTLAETCMRELVGRASFGHIRCVLKPVLRHLDNHNLWVPNQFAIHTFRIIIFSIQAQYSYTVVEMLMSHLDENAKSNPKIRTSIADVLSKIIAIAAGESVGPSVLEIINSLLTHLRVSVTHESPDGGFDKRDEQQYQEALINALGEFANHLPDFQKIEIMMFIMSKVPTPSIDNLRGLTKEGDDLLQNILLKSLLKVGTKYQTIHFNTTFPLSFLEPLLRMCLAADPDMRLLVHKILHTLIDRHNNLEKLLKPTIHISELELLIEKPSRPDMIFLRKHGPSIYLSVYESIEQANNTVENIEACYTTLALLCVELCSEETLADFIRLLISIQDVALTNGQLTIAQRFNIHAIVAALLALLPHVVSISALGEYVDKVLEARPSHLLPELLVHYDPETCLPPSQLEPTVLLDQVMLTECLKGAGFDVSRLQGTTPYSTGSAILAHRHSWVEAGVRGSSSDLNSFQIEVDSENSSPGIQRKHPEEELTFESMKRILSENIENKTKVEEERRLQLSEAFRTATFEDLINRTQSKNDALQNKLNDIFTKLSTSLMEGIRAPPTPTPQCKLEALGNQDIQAGLKYGGKAPAYEVLFPELFLY